MPILTTTESLRDRMVTVESDERKLEAYLVEPKNMGRVPGVLVIHEIVGLNDYIKDVSRRLGQAGFIALAPNLFCGIAGIDSNDPSATRKVLANVSDHQFIKDIAAACNFLTGLPNINGKVGVIGFCWGGFYALVAGEQVPGLTATVAYYGPIKVETSDIKPYHPSAQAHLMQTRVLCIYGEADQSIPIQDAHELASRLRELGKHIELITYPGAPHGFHNDTRPDRYIQGAAKDAWEKTEAFLNRTLR